MSDTTAQLLPQPGGLRSGTPPSTAPPGPPIGPAGQAPVPALRDPMAVTPQGLRPPTSPQVLTSADLMLTPTAVWLQMMEQQLAAGLLELPNPARLAGICEEKFQEYRMRRLMIEQEMLEAAHRYNGEYYGTIKARLDAQPNRSKIWVDLTRAKTDAAHADTMEIMRGNGTDQPWALRPEAIPDTLELPPALTERGVTVQMLREDFEKRGRGMNTVITNQLEESDFPIHLDALSFESCLFGTGAAKGPFTISSKSYRWMVTYDDDMKVIASKVQQAPYRPAMTYVPIVNIYANMEKQRPQLSDGLIEEYPCTRRDLIDMASWPGFMPAAILQVLKTWPEGNYMPLPHILVLRSLHRDARPSFSNLYHVKIHYGEIKGSELRQAGVKLDPSLDSFSIPCETWWCGNYVICARHLPLPQLPVYLVPYRLRGTQCPYGIGVPVQLRWCQDAVNGAARIIMDNAAMASGPMVEWNEALMRLDPGNDPNDIRGFKVVVSSHDGNNNKAAIRVTEIKPYTDIFMGIINLFWAKAEDLTGIASLTQGIQGADTKTATGMGILNTNSYKNRNHTLRYLDDMLIKPMVSAFFEWNMHFGDDESIKVPCRVEPMGSASLASTQQETQRLIQAIQISTGQPWFKIRNAARRLFRALGLPVDEITMTDGEWAQYVQSISNQAPAPGGPGHELGQGPGAAAPEQPPPAQTGQPGNLQHQQPMTTPSTLPSGGAETMP